MFDLTTLGPAMISIGGITAIVELLRRLGGSDSNPLDDSLPKGTQEEEPVRFRFPKLSTPASAGAAA